MEAPYNRLLLFPHWHLKFYAPVFICNYGNHNLLCFTMARTEGELMLAFKAMHVKWLVHFLVKAVSFCIKLKSTKCLLLSAYIFAKTFYGGKKTIEFLAGQMPTTVQILHFSLDCPTIMLVNQKIILSSNDTVRILFFKIYFVLVHEY